MVSPPRLCVYHCVDRWDSFGTYDAVLMRKVDEQCCRYADVVIASSRDLYERCRSYNPNTHLVNHGVDLAHFMSARGGLDEPADQHSIRRRATRHLGGKIADTIEERCSGIVQPVSPDAGVGARPSLVQTAREATKSGTRIARTSRL